MALKRFVKSSGTGDKYPTGDHLNKPVYVQPLEKFSGLKTDYDEEGTKVVLRANVYDLNEKQAYARVVFFNDALVDGLGQFLGEETVVRFADIKTKDGKRTFRGVLDGTDDDYSLAESMMDDIRAAIEAREAELDSEDGPGSGAPAQDTAQAAAVKGAFKR
jgi:hypothetical protein